jgi:hypothetical protein
MSNYNIQYQLDITNPLNLTCVVANSEEEARNVGLNMLMEIVESTPIGDFGLAIKLISLTKEEPSEPRYTPLVSLPQQDDNPNEGYTSMASLHQQRSPSTGYSRLT